MAIRPDKIDRLKSQLLTSGLSQQNSALYQVISQLIDAVKQLITTSNSSGGGGGGGGVVNNITNITQQVLNPLASLYDDCCDAKFYIPVLVPGSSPSPSPDGYWAPLTDGDLVDTDLIFAAGECVMVFVPV